MIDAPGSVAEYLAGLDPSVREATAAAWGAVRAAVPDGVEAISYGIPALKVDGRGIVHVGGWATHVAVYPVPGDEALAAELAPYRHGRGTLRFPLSEPLPLTLIARVAESLAAERRR